MTEFVLDIEKFAEKARQQVIKIRMEAQRDIVDGVVDRHPVDTKLSSHNWLGNRGAPMTYSIPLSAIGNPKAQAKKSAIGVDGIWYLVNNVDYSVYLEYGHSRQAPNGMARLAVQEVANKLKG